MLSRTFCGLVQGLLFMLVLARPPAFACQSRKSYLVAFGIRRGSGLLHVTAIERVVLSKATLSATRIRLCLLVCDESSPRTLVMVSPASPCKWCLRLQAPPVRAPPEDIPHHVDHVVDSFFSKSQGDTARQATEAVYSNIPDIPPSPATSCPSAFLFEVPVYSLICI